MKSKNIFLKLTMIILMITFLVMPEIVFAKTATTPMYLGIVEFRTNNEPYMAYSISNPDDGGHILWNMVQYASENATEYSKRNIYCLNPDVGFTSGVESREKYDTYYDMKQEKDTVKELVTMTKTKNDITLTDGTKVNIYDVILALGDMLYLPGKSAESEKTELLAKVKERARTDSSASSYYNQMDQYPLTDDDIDAIQQAVFWYFSNYGESRYDKYNATSWLNYKIESMTSYESLSGYEAPKGAVRNAQANVLYKYLIETAEENAKNYSTNTEAPAVVATTKLNYVESGDNYVIGPIRINENPNSSIPYTIGFVVKNSGSEVTSFKLLNSSKQDVTGTKTVKDLVGQDFYISMPKSSVTNVSVDIDINYSESKLTLWTFNGDVAGTQPVLVPEKTPKSVSVHLTVEPESKPFDLALRKYITKINGKELTNTRVPNIDESTLTSGTTATYKHRKDPVAVETGDLVTYKLTIYNEGEKEGRATKIIDQLPTGLKFKKVVSGNFDADSSYSESSDNKLILNRKANNTNNLTAYSTGNLSSETIEIECEVIAKPDTKNQKVLTNVAWISEEIDAVSGTVITNQKGLDRDSEPATHPEVNKDNMSDYKGKSTNKSTLDDKNYHYEGEQDDDDFEKLVLNPQTFDLKLIKNIVEVNGKSVTERIKSIDVSKLNISSGAKTTADYKLEKNPVSVAKGDIVTYRLRVYNEGTLDGYASEITEDIPQGLEFLWSEKQGTELSSDTTLTDEEKEAIAFNQQYLWGNFVYDENRDRIIKISSEYLSRNNETEIGDGSNLIKAFGKNDGTKTSANLSYEEIFVKMKVISDNITGITIRNEACISKDSDKDGNEIDDRDSTPEEWKKEDSDESYDDEGKWKIYKEDDEDYDNIILKPFDLALRKFIIAVSDDETIQNGEYLKETDGSYTRAPKVDTSKLNTIDSTTGKLITTATYNHPKEPVEVKKGNIVVYMLRVYNEGDIDGYAAEIKDHLPSNLEFVDGNYNKQYGWTISEDGKTVTTKYLENELIKAVQIIDGGTQPYKLSYKEVPIMCRVKDTAKVDEKITNIADITKYLDDNKKSVTDRDSQENNVDSTEGNKPDYKDTEINRGDKYIPGQQDDDDFEKVIIPRFDLALRKQITSIYNSFIKKETKYNNRYAKLDKNQKNTIYDYYDVESNIPTVVENDVVTYSIRVYNEGKVDGTATWITDRLPSGLQYLPDDETNKKFGWKAFKQSTATAEKAIKIGEKYYEEVGYDSKDIYMYATEYLKDSTIKAYSGEGEASYGEVFMTTRVKAKYEVADGVEYKLRNIAEIGDDDNDDDDSTPGDESKWKDQDDVDIEDLKLVEFDLALRKWVTQAIVIDSKGQTVTETGHQPYDDPEQVVKVELHRRKLNEVTVKFRYSIRIINEGDIAGYAKEIKDYIPQGLKFVAEDNPGWKDEGNNLISTTLLENTLLQPGEFADVEVLLTWINDQDNMGVMVNTAEISKDYNEYGVPDRDSIPDNKKWGEDDIDDAPVMLSISTGQVRIYFTLGFVVLITIAGGVVLIKKYVL